MKAELIRKNNRSNDCLREITFVRDYTKYAEGSVLTSFGDTVVLCNASVENILPAWKKDKIEGGWVTAEYSMLPRSTNTRNSRNSSTFKPNARSLEIQRLVARSLRSCVSLEKLGNRTITVDCDVIQADGGTRTAAVTGGFLALSDACQKIFDSKIDCIKNNVAAVSVGIFAQNILLDLDYDEDSSCDADINLIMNSIGQIVEIQGTAEKNSFSEQTLNKVILIAKSGLREIFSLQKKMQNSRELKSVSIGGDS